MAEKSLGFVELEWTCPACGARNPGSQRKCLQCGAPQPEEVKFEQAAQESFVTDEAKIAEAEAGPDIYCSYCGTRNAADAKVCKQCGAPLSEGKARQAGEVLGGLRSEPAPPQICPACGTENEATALKCVNCGAPLGKPVPAETPPPTPARPGWKPGWLPIAILAVVAVAAILLIVQAISRGSQTQEVVGRVVDYGWQRTIAVQAFVPVVREGWRDEVPAGAELGACRQEVYEVVSEWVPNSREVCGTPYVVDTGSGYGEVKQDCQYEVYADYCQYQVLAWVAAAPIVLSGRDFDPLWPATQLASNQRTSSTSEEYVVIFQANDREYRYTTASEAEYLRFRQGGDWLLEVSGFGGVSVLGEAAEQ